MANIDLDAARAARTEVTKEAPTVLFGGVEFSLPVEVPFGVFVHLGTMRDDPEGDGANAMKGLIDALFGERSQEFIDLGPSLEDIKDLLEGALEAYGMETLGEASASATS